jgi:hypothetical protein
LSDDPLLLEAVRRYGRTIEYPGGVFCDRLTGEVLWRPGDDPGKKPGAPTTFPSPPDGSPAASSPAPNPRGDERLPPLNFDLVEGRYLLTPKTPSALRREQDRYLSQIVPLAPGYPMWVQHFEDDGWHRWGAGCHEQGDQYWPIWTRTVLPNEVIFECDMIAPDGTKAGSYVINRTHTRRVLSALGKAKIPYVANISGSKGIHVSVYLTLPEHAMAQQARRLRTLVWVRMLRAAGYTVRTTPTGRPTEVTDSDGSVVKWDPATVWWVSRHQIHCWGDLARDRPYTWAGFRLPEERPRELRMPPHAMVWDPLAVEEIRLEWAVPDPAEVYEREAGADSPAIPVGPFDPSSCAWLVDRCAPPESEHDHELMIITLTLKGLGASLDQTKQFFRDHWRPAGSCSSPSHRLGDALYTRLRNFYGSRLVIRPSRWKPPEFQEPTDGSAPVLLPGQARRNSETVCPFGVTLGKKYRHHPRGGNHHVVPYNGSCNNELCPDHFARVAHRAAATATSELAVLLHAPEAPVQRNTALEEFDPEADHVRGLRFRARRPVDQYAPAEDWKVRPVRMVIGLPKTVGITGTKAYRLLRERLEDVARSQSFRIHRTIWHDRPGTHDVRKLCTEGWHLEAIGAFDGKAPRANSEPWTEPTSGCSITFAYIAGSVLQLFRSIRMTAARVVDTIEEAKLALGTVGAAEPTGAPTGEGAGGDRRVSQVRVHVQAESACHDLCLRPDRHPKPPEQARWCVLCPPEEAWIPRRAWERCTPAGPDRPPDRPISVDRETFLRGWVVETPGWFREPASRHSRVSDFDQAMFEENHGWET